jgi:hypothetical protein
MYNFFYNTTPMDISLELYDSNGVLQTYVVPNRAKDLKYVTNGSGSPEGIVTADVGTVYSDTTNGVLYMKVLSSGSNTGWVVLATLNALQNILFQGTGTPEGNITASQGALYSDITSAELYIKTTLTGNTGWETFLRTNDSNIVTLNGTQTIINKTMNANQNNFTNFSLSNFSSGVVQDTIRDVSSASNNCIVTELAIANLKNITQSNQNLVQSINSTSLSTTYPSTATVYNNIQNSNIPLYCIYNGARDSSGNANILNRNSLYNYQLDFNVGADYPSLSCKDTIGNTFLIPSLTSIKVSSYATGTYNVFVDSSSNVTIYSNVIYRQQAQPTTMNANDRWVQLVDPLRAYVYNGTDLTLDTSVPIGWFTTANNEISTWGTFAYSYNGWDLRASTVPLSIAPDYSKAVSITLPYTVLKEGWIQAGVSGAWGAHTINVNGLDFVGILGSSDARYTDYSAGMCMVSKGDIISNPNGGFTGGKYIPFK